MGGSGSHDIRVSCASDKGLEASAGAPLVFRSIPGIGQYFPAVAKLELAMTSIPRGRRDGLVVNKNILCYEGLRTHNFMPTREHAGNRDSFRHRRTLGTQLVMPPKFPGGVDSSS